MEIVEIGAQGDGVADSGGERIFIPLTAPGDVAAIERRGGRGRLLEIVRESPRRAAAPCPHYGVCGGCSLQHVDRDFYLNWKRERVTQALARAGLGGAPVNDVVEIPAASRRRASFAVRKTKHVAALGFNARHSDHVVAISTCEILHKDLFAALPKLKAVAALIAAPAFDMAVTLCRNGLDVDIQGKTKEPHAKELLALTDAADDAQCVRLSLNGDMLVTIEQPIIDFDGVLVTPPPGVFLQASKKGEAVLLSLVKDAVGGARRICDLFAGCGSFALPLARTATVTAVDSDQAALAALAAAAAGAQRRGEAMNPVAVETRNLFESPMQADALNAFDAIIFDPPRAGAAAQAAEIAKSAVPVVVGVSCNPATFTRDAALLTSGGYELAAVTPVDQFVYSSHIELAGVFRRT